MHLQAIIDLISRMGILKMAFPKFNTGINENHDASLSIQNNNNKQNKSAMQIRIM